MLGFDFALIVILGIVLVYDYHFVGFIFGVLGLHEWNRKSESAVFVINVGRIRSNYLSGTGEVEQITEYAQQKDAILEVSTTSVYIGKRRLSHHYRIPFTQISHASGRFQGRSKHTLILYFDNDSKLFVEIDNVVVSEATRQTLMDLTCYIEQQIKCR